MVDCLTARSIVFCVAAIQAKAEIHSFRALQEARFAAGQKDPDEYYRWPVPNYMSIVLYDEARSGISEPL